MQDREVLLSILDKDPHTPRELSELSGIDIITVWSDLRWPKLKSHPNLVYERDMRTDVEVARDRQILNDLFDRGPHTAKQLSSKSGIALDTVFRDLINDPVLKSHPNRRYEKKSRKKSAKKELPTLNDLEMAVNRALASGTPYEKIWAWWTVQISTLTKDIRQIHDFLKTHGAQIDRIAGRIKTIRPSEPDTSSKQTIMMTNQYPISSVAMQYPRTSSPSEAKNHVHLLSGKRFVVSSPLYSANSPQSTANSQEAKVQNSVYGLWTINYGLSSASSPGYEIDLQRKADEIFRLGYYFIILPFSYKSGKSFVDVSILHRDVPGNIGKAEVAKFKQFRGDSFYGKVNFSLEGNGDMHFSDLWPQMPPGKKLGRYAILVTTYLGFNPYDGKEHKFTHTIPAVSKALSQIEALRVKEIQHGQEGALPPINSEIVVLWHQKNNENIKQAQGKGNPFVSSPIFFTSPMASSPALRPLSDRLQRTQRKHQVKPTASSSVGETSEWNVVLPVNEAWCIVHNNPVESYRNKHVLDRHQERIAAILNNGKNKVMMLGGKIPPSIIGHPLATVNTIPVADTTPFKTVEDYTAARNLLKSWGVHRVHLAGQFSSMNEAGRLNVMRGGANGCVGAAAFVVLMMGYTVVIHPRLSLSFQYEAIDRAPYQLDPLILQQDISLFKLVQNVLPFITDIEFRDNTSPSLQTIQSVDVNGYKMTWELLCKHFSIEEIFHFFQALINLPERQTLLSANMSDGRIVQVKSSPGHHSYRVDEIVILTHSKNSGGTLPNSMVTASSPGRNSNLSKEDCRVSPLAVLSEEELIGFTQDVMSPTASLSDLALFSYALAELKSRGWIVIFIVTCRTYLNLALFNREPFVDYSQARVYGKYLYDPDGANKRHYEVLKDLFPKVFSEEFVNLSIGDFLDQFLGHSRTNFLQHSQEDVCLQLIKLEYGQDGGIELARAVSLNKGSPFWDSVFNRELPILEALRPRRTGGRGHAGIGLNGSISFAHFARIETHHDKVGCRIESTSHFDYPKILYQYSRPDNLPYVYGVILDAIYYAKDLDNEPWQAVAQRDINRIEGLKFKCREGFFAGEVDALKGRIKSQGLGPASSPLGEAEGSPADTQGVFNNAGSDNLEKIEMAESNFPWAKELRSFIAREGFGEAVSKSFTFRDISMLRKSDGHYLRQMIGLLCQAHGIDIPISLRAEFAEKLEAAGWRWGPRNPYPQAVSGVFNSLQYAENEAELKRRVQEARGVLAAFLRDPASKNSFWFGPLSRLIDASEFSEEQTKAVQFIVERILRAFALPDAKALRPELIASIKIANLENIFELTKLVMRKLMPQFGRIYEDSFTVSGAKMFVQAYINGFITLGPLTAAAYRMSRYETHGRSVSLRLLGISRIDECCLRSSLCGLSAIVAHEVGHEVLDRLLSAPLGIAPADRGQNLREDLICSGLEGIFGEWCAREFGEDAQNWYGSMGFGDSISAWAYRQGQRIVREVSIQDWPYAIEAYDFPDYFRRYGQGIILGGIARQLAETSLSRIPAHSDIQACERAVDFLAYFARNVEDLSLYALPDSATMFLRQFEIEPGDNIILRPLAPLQCPARALLGKVNQLGRIKLSADELSDALMMLGCAMFRTIDPIYLDYQGHGDISGVRMALYAQQDQFYSRFSSLSEEQIDLLIEEKLRQYHHFRGAQPVTMIKKADRPLDNRGASSVAVPERVSAVLAGARDAITREAEKILKHCEGPLSGGKVPQAGKIQAEQRTYNSSFTKFSVSLNSKNAALYGSDFKQVESFPAYTAPGQAKYLHNLQIKSEDKELSIGDFIEMLLYARKRREQLGLSDHWPVYCHGLSDKINYLIRYAEPSVSVYYSSKRGRSGCECWSVNLNGEFFLEKEGKEHKVRIGWATLFTQDDDFLLRKHLGEDFEKSDATVLNIHGHPPLEEGILPAQSLNMSLADDFAFKTGRRKHPVNGITAYAAPGNILLRLYALDAEGEFWCQDFSIENNENVVGVKQRSLIEKYRPGDGDYYGGEEAPLLPPKPKTGGGPSSIITTRLSPRLSREIAFRHGLSQGNPRDSPYYNFCDYYHVEKETFPPQINSYYPAAVKSAQAASKTREKKSKALQVENREKDDFRASSPLPNQAHRTYETHIIVPGLNYSQGDYLALKDNEMTVKGKEVYRRLLGAYRNVSPAAGLNNSGIKPQPVRILHMEMSHP
ncbi:MAG: hypothetical protein WC546_03700 [Candidatus Omnitrophota bacterium]